MKKIVLIFASLLFAHNQASAETPAVKNHVLAYVAAACPSTRAPELKSLKRVETVKVGPKRTFIYEASVKSGQNTYVSLQISTNDDKGRVQKISKAYLPKGCHADYTKLKLTCGDHWLTTDLDIDLSVNKAELIISGDSKSENETYSAKTRYKLEDNALRISLQTRESGQTVSWELEPDRLDNIVSFSLSREGKTSTGCF